MNDYEIFALLPRAQAITTAHDVSIAAGLVPIAGTGLDDYIPLAGSEVGVLDQDHHRAFREPVAKLEREGGTDRPNAPKLSANLALRYLLAVPFYEDSQTQSVIVTTLKDDMVANWDTNGMTRRNGDRMIPALLRALFASNVEGVAIAKSGQLLPECVIALCGSDAQVLYPSCIPMAIIAPEERARRYLAAAAHLPAPHLRGRRVLFERHITPELRAVIEAVVTEASE